MSPAVKEALAVADSTINWVAPNSRDKACVVLANALRESLADNLALRQSVQKAVDHARKYEHDGGAVARGGLQVLIAMIDEALSKKEGA